MITLFFNFVILYLLKGLGWCIILIILHRMIGKVFGV